jgi:hypothetical protein
MPRWEYKIVCFQEEDAYQGDEGSEQAVLAQYGAEGWELASVLETRLGRGHLTYAYFKRPVMSTEASHA